MKKCAFSSSFASGKGEKRQDFSLLDSLLSVVGASRATRTQKTGAVVDSRTDGEERSASDTAAASDDGFAKSVEIAKNRSHENGKTSKTVQNPRYDDRNFSQNGENRKNGGDYYSPPPCYRI